MMGGRDKKGLFIAYGPMTKMVWMIFWWTQTDNDPPTWGWVPYKVFNKDDQKTYRRAKRLVWNLRFAANKIRYKVDKGWVAVPIEEMQKEYYANENEAKEAIRQRLGIRRTQRFAMGLGGPGTENLTTSVWHDKAQGKLAQILNQAGPEGIAFRASPLPIDSTEGEDRETGTEDNGLRTKELGGNERGPGPGDTGNA